MTGQAKRAVIASAENFFFTGSIFFERKTNGARMNE